MVWIFAAVVLILAVYVPGFRKILLIGAGLIAALGFIAFLSGQSSRQASDTGAAAPASISPPPPPPPPKLIPVENIQVGEVRSNFGNGRVSSVTVRIHNNSEQQTLLGADFRLRIDDCVGVSKEAPRCATVDDEAGNIYIEVPPKQARDTSIGLKASPWNEVTILGRPRITVQITMAHAK